MLFYKIIYSLTWKKELLDTLIREDKFEEKMKQFKKWIVLSWDNVIHGIYSLRKLKIIEQNYKYKNNEWCFYDEDFTDNNWNSEIYKNVNCYEIEKDFKPYEKDVTDDIIIKYWILTDKPIFSYNEDEKSLYFWDNFIHSFSWDRNQFIKVMFNHKILEWVSFKEIQLWLDISYDNSTLSSKQDKSIRNLKDKINSIIYKKIYIKKLFSVRKKAYTSEFYRNY